MRPTKHRLNSARDRIRCLPLATGIFIRLRFLQARGSSFFQRALTAPYMHDGSAKTLDEVLDHYSSGGRTIANAGEGFHNPNKDPLIRGFKLSQADRADLIAFLQSLADDSVIQDAKLADPRKDGHP
jgi:hypothetical protein